MHDDALPATRSVAVTIIAALSITAASFGVLATLGTLALQALAGDALAQATAETLAGYPDWYARATPLLTAFNGLLYVAVLLASIALAMRRGWGRRAFLACLVPVALMAVLGIVLVPFVDTEALMAAQEVPPGLEGLGAMVLYLGAAWNLGLLVLFGWYAWHLTRPHVVAEFS